MNYKRNKKIIILKFTYISKKDYESEILIINSVNKIRTNKDKVKLIDKYIYILLIILLY